MIAIIACIAKNGVIGPITWHHPADLQRFKFLTMGYPIIMGRKTWESLPVKPLIWRKNIVVTRGEDVGIVDCVSSLEAALALYPDSEKQFIIGGGELYKQALPLVDVMYLTRLNECHVGDTVFPVFDEDEWEETFRWSFDGGVFVDYKRRVK